MRLRIISLSIFMSFFNTSLFSETFDRANKDLGLPKYSNSMSAKDKSDYMNKLIAHTNYGEKLPSTIPNFRQACNFLSYISNLGPSFDRNSDIMPYQRREGKVVHLRGSTVPVVVKFNVNSEFTGALSGEIPEMPGLVRISLAAPAAIGSKKNHVFGHTLKIFQDGAKSLDLQFMKALTGQGANSDPFAFPLSNHLPPLESDASPAFKALAWWFGKFSSNPASLSVKHMGSAKADGSPLYELVFDPTGNKVGISTNAEGDFRTELNKVKPGTELYKIFARKSKGGLLVEVGSVETTDNFTASKAGDNWVFFKHDTDTRTEKGK